MRHDDRQQAGSRVLITGGAGFIGSHLAETLLSDGHSVHVFDNLSTGSRDNVAHLLTDPRFQLTQGDITDSRGLEELIRESDSVFHLAAAVGVKLIMEKPVETLVTNVRGTEEILKSAARHDVPVFIASTSEVYGKTLERESEWTALRETDPSHIGPTTRKRWAYACSKALDEFLALAYHEEYGTRVVIGRFFNTVGTRQTGHYGMVIPRFVQSALTGEPLEVHGDGEQTRSFTHVADAVWAMIKLMDTPEAIGGVFNIGNGEVISINELAERIVQLTGTKSKIVHVPYDEVYGDGFEDMQRRTPDIRKLQEMIGYRPELGIGEILKDVVAYFEEEVLAEGRTPDRSRPATRDQR